MKFLIVAVLVSVALAAPQKRPTGGALQATASATLGGPQEFGQAQPSGTAKATAKGRALQFEARTEVQDGRNSRAMNKASSEDARAEITEQDFQMPDPGHYQLMLRTSNGIETHQQAELEGDSGKVMGSYSFVAPDGKTYKVEYVADELGFHPVGDHLPQAPAVPEDILRSLEWNEKHPEEDESQMEPKMRQ